MSTFAKVIRALLLAFAVNSAGLYLMIQVNQYIHAPQKKVQTKTKTIHLQDQPKKKHRKIARRQLVKTRPRTVPMPIPHLSSSLSSEAFGLPGIGDVDLLSDLLNQGHGLDAHVILMEEAVDEPPRVVHYVSPEYPFMAEDNGIEGYVVFKLQVSKNGIVEKIWIEDADPPGVFEAAAQKAVQQYRFSPAQFRGQPVAVMCKQKLVFKLED